VCCKEIDASPVAVTEIMLFIGKQQGRSKMISNATNPLRESRKESLLRRAGSASICESVAVCCSVLQCVAVCCSVSICEWLVCDLVVCAYSLYVCMCIQAVGDRALDDLCVCVRCGSVESQKV